MKMAKYRDGKVVISIAGLTNINRRIMIKIGEIIEIAKKHQQLLYLYINETSQKQLIIDLKQVLKSKDDSHYGIQIIENLDNGIKINLLDELLFVYIYGNVSDSYLAKMVILSIDRRELEHIIQPKIWCYLERENNDVEIITQLAQLLYELKYETLLNKIKHQFYEILLNSGFIDPSEDS